MFGWKKFGSGLLTHERGEFHYREDTGRHYGMKSSILFWNPQMSGKHYDWIRVKTDMGWVKEIEGQETIRPLTDDK